MSRFAADAHAKINLALAVTGVRDDGYHTLRSVFLRLALHDRLEVELDPAASADSLDIEGELEADADNLVLRAAAAPASGHRSLAAAAPLPPAQAHPCRGRPWGRQL